MVIIDTSAWVEFLRRPNSPAGEETRKLLQDGVALLAGPIVAELLQGVDSEPELERLADSLAALPFAEGSKDTWFRVGRLAFHLRRAGHVVGPTDLYIAAIAMEHEAAVYTLDRDFERIGGLQLHQPGTGESPHGQR